MSSRAGKSLGIDCRVDTAAVVRPVSDVEDVVSMGVRTPPLRHLYRDDGAFRNLLPPEPGVAFDGGDTVHVDESFASLPGVLIVIIDTEQLHLAGAGVLVKLCPLLRGRGVSLGLFPACQPDHHAGHSDQEDECSHVGTLEVGSDIYIHGIIELSDPYSPRP